MRVLVTGCTGQLGYDVLREGKNLGLDIFGINTKDVDITDKQRVQQHIKSLKPHVIIHCAAYTAVDRAEEDKINCYDVNVNGTRNIVEVAKEIDAKVVYMSTDYVFDGQNERPYGETENANPIGYYGMTKFEGEKIVQSLLNKMFIVRISWVFGINGNNFIKTMLTLSESKDELNVVGDQFGSPTYTVDLSRFLMNLIKTDYYGIYHASNEGYCSWAELAKEIFKQSEKKTIVKSITSDQYPTKVVRPKNSRMSKQKIYDCGFEKFPSWEDALERFLSELNNEKKN